MRLRDYGTRRPTNFAGGLMRRGVVLLAALLLVSVLMAGAVSADTAVAKIGEHEYATLYDAFNDTVAGEKTTITLLRDASGGGAILQSGNNTILDLNNHTFTVVNPTVGSPGTETSGFQLLKNSDITIKNGKITSTAAKFLIQNYANLTLDNVELDGSNLIIDKPYTLSNNFGNVVLKGNTKITAKTGGVAFDVYYWPSHGDGIYAEGVSVTIADSGVVIDGPVEFTCDVTQTSDHASKANLIVPYGYDLPSLAVCTHFDTYYWKATDNNNMMQLTFSEAPITALNDSIVVSADGTKATLLRDVTLTQTAEVAGTITLDLNGKNLSKSADHALLINGANAALTLMNGNAAKKGWIIGGSKSGTTITAGSAVKMEQGKLVIKKDVVLYGAGNGDGISVRPPTSAQNNYAVITIEQGAIVQAPYGIYVYQNPDSPAHGVVINIYGTLTGLAPTDPFYNGEEGSYGLFIDGDHCATDIYPQVNIYEDAVVTGYGYPAIASMGYGKHTIHGGTITGTEALSVKGGEWIVRSGTFIGNGEFHDPVDENNSGPEKSGSAVSITNTYMKDREVNVTILGGTFTSTNAFAIYSNASKKPSGTLNSHANITGITITGGTFRGNSDKVALKLNLSLMKSGVNPSITGGKYSTAPDKLYLPAGYAAVKDGDYYIIGKEVPKPTATVTTDPTTGAVTEIDATSAVTGGSIETPTPQTDVPTITLELKASNQKTGDKITLNAADGQTISITAAGVVTGQIASAIITPGEIKCTDGTKISLSLTTTDLEHLFGGAYTLQITNAPKASDMGDTTPEIIAGISVTIKGLTYGPTKMEFKNILAGSKTPQVWHAKDGNHYKVKSTYSGTTVTTIATEFSSYYVTLTSTPIPPDPPQPVYSSGDGNMENAFRVLFETQGGSYVSPATGLSYGDKITAPANPVRDGYTFGGWYKDAACTQAWSFSDAIDGDMTLYAKWTGGSAAQQTTTATASATAQPTTKQTSAPAATTSQSQASATTAAPAATTAAGVSPTLTQAPAPVFGALLGLLAAGVLLRRRD